MARAVALTSYATWVEEFEGVPAVVIERYDRDPCTDDGAGLVYFGTELVEAVTERDGAKGWIVRRDGDVAVEQPLPTRKL